MSNIPYGTIPRNEILTIEKQILRDIATLMAEQARVLKTQASIMYLLPARNAIWEIERMAKDLERLAE